MRWINASRAAVSFVIGIFITFSQSHEASIGLLALGLFGIGYAVANGVTTSVFGKGLLAIENMPLTISAFTIGLLALLVPAANPGAQHAAFIFLVTGWALVSGSFELYLARRAGFKSQNGRETLINSVFSLLLGVLFLIAPLDVVSAVGFFGAYLIMSAVHLGIAAGSPVIKTEK